LKEKIGKKMKPRERVIAALNHQKVDRPPFQATFTPEFAERLRTKLNILGKPPYDPHSFRWSGYELEKATGQDALQFGMGWSTNYYLDDKPYEDDWGIGWSVAFYDTAFGKGFYSDITHHPLKEDPSQVDHYTAPDPNAPKLYHGLERLIKEEKDDYYIIGRIHCTIFETAWALRGMVEMFMDMVENKDLADKILEIPYQHHLQIAKNMAERGVDMIWLGDDVGGQNGMLMSPDMWRYFFKERMKTIILEIKKINPEIKVAYHSCGNVLSIIPDLIEVGLDVLNPIQAECMDLEFLQKEYGDRLCFFGGINVQSTLPFGSQKDIINEVQHGMNTIGKNGGWICAPTHHVQQDTPMENYYALVDAVHELKY
jgi:uroporphyrinogen-III decarboxylase